MLNNAIRWLYSISLLSRCLMLLILLFADAAYAYTICLKHCIRSGIDRWEIIYLIITVLPIMLISKLCLSHSKMAFNILLSEINGFKPKRIWKENIYIIVLTLVAFSVPIYTKGTIDWHFHFPTYVYYGMPFSIFIMPIAISLLPAILGNIYNNSNQKSDFSISEKMAFYFVILSLWLLFFAKAYAVHLMPFNIIILALLAIIIIISIYLAHIYLQNEEVKGFYRILNLCGFALLNTATLLTLSSMAILVICFPFYLLK